MSALLEIREVSKAFGGVQAVNRVSLDVNAGDLMSVIGPNGAGKTTLLNMVSGFYHPDRGQLLLDGADVTHAPPFRVAERGVARTFQNIALFRGMTVLDNLMLGRHVHMKTGVVGAFVYWGLAQKEEVVHRRRVEDIIDFLRIQDLRRRPCGSLAYGLQKRVELGRALALDPKILLLDEPMGGCNHEEKEDMARFILDVNEEWGTTIILIEHDMGVVMDISDRVAVLDMGSKIAEGTPDEVRANPQVIKAYLGETKPAAQEGDVAETLTLPRHLLRNAAQHAGRPAIREKDRGIWQTYTWREYHAHVRDIALGLAALGFARGDKLSVIGDNRPRLYWAQVSAMCLGGVSVPVYQDAIAKELAYVMNHAEVSVVVAEDQEQVDKILTLKDQLPALKLVIYEDPRGMSQYKSANLRSLDDVEELGRRFGAEHPGHFEAEIGKGRLEDVALIAYTSGTTGNPKGAMLTHANLVETGQTLIKSEDIRIDDNWLAYLPMAWVGDSLYTLVINLMVGFTVNCPESPETVQRDLRELGPTSVLAPPRIWENMLTGVQVRAADAPRLKRWVFDTSRAAAERAEILRSEGKAVPLGLRLRLALGEFFVYGPVRDQLGLRRARWAYTGGAPLGPDTFRFFRGFGVNLKQVYGSTELTGLVSLQPDAEANPTTAGRPCPGIDVKIGERGEVLVKSAGIFKGYFKNDEATREVMDPDGWFRTGDAGFVDPRGHLVIIDRAKDVGALADGTAFAPQFIENKLKFSPYIREAVAFGHERPFVTAMIAIDPNTAGSWAERRGLAYTSYTDLSQKPEVRGLIAEEIRRGNQTLPDAQKVRRFLLLTKDLEADDAEMTRTRKVRRRHVAEKYAPVTDAFYSGQDSVELTTAITYEDGRQGSLRSTVHIEDVEGVAARV